MRFCAKLGMMFDDEELRHSTVWNTIDEIDTAIEKYAEDFPVKSQSRFWWFTSNGYCQYTLWMLQKPKPTCPESVTFGDKSHCETL